MNRFFVSTFITIISLTLFATVFGVAQTNTFSVQGVLRDPSGKSVTDGTYSVTFTLYNVSTGGSALWTETQDVSVSYGVFGVKLGTVTTLPGNFNTSKTYYLGFSVSGGSELSPRLELSRSFSALTSYEVAGDSNQFPGNGKVGIGTLTPTEPLHVEGNIKLTGNIKFGDGSKISSATNATIPSGLIAMWSGSLDEIPEGWALCDGTNSTPNLSGRFIVGYSSTKYSTLGATGGNDSITLTLNQMPSHTHTISGGSHSHDYRDRYFIESGIENVENNGVGGSESTTNSEDITGSGNNDTNNDVFAYTNKTTDSATHTHTVANTGGGLPFDNRPAFYVLAYIIKL